MISYQKALDIILNHSKPAASKIIALRDSLNYVAAENLVCKHQIPGFRNSAMDGYAIKSSDTLDAKITSVTLNVTSSIAAGDLPLSNTYDKHQSCTEIMTGARIPDQFDAVVPIEEVTISQKHDNNQKITITQPIKANANIRFPGEDFQINDSIISMGEYITTTHIMAAAAAGICNIKVYQKPTVTIIATGKELSDNYEEQLTGSTIYNSNSPYLSAELLTYGIQANYTGIIPDNKDAFIKTINHNTNQIIITTGAVSKGKFDFIPDALNEIGANILFHKVNIRPGKPILFAILPNNTYFFGLPGNPISSAIGLRFFVLQLIRNILTLKQEVPLKAKLNTAFDKKSNFRHFLKAKASIDNNATLKVNILPKQGSFQISSLLETNVWAVAQEDKNNYTQGELIDIYPIAFNTHLFKS